MNIALIGYGKMGHMIEEIALKRGNSISCRIDKDNLSDFNSDAFRASDVAIEFTTPNTAAENISRCFDAGIPVVCGTTGWTSLLPQFKQLCDNGQGSLLWSSNFSIGVNIFMAVNRYLATVMANFPQYDASMLEVHHVHKLDHPSGTAITLAEQIIAANSRYSAWNEPDSLSAASPSTLPIMHRREGEVPGIHTINWISDVDEISITHSAKSRAGFALGAVMAAEWLPSHPGFHTVGEMLNDITNQDIFK